MKAILKSKFYENYPYEHFPVGSAFNLFNFPADNTSSGFLA
jgi:hypothetical protein